MVLRSNLEPNFACKVFQKLGVNYITLSNMMEIGIPCNGTISQIYSLTNFSALLVTMTEMKCRNLVNL